VKHNRELIDAVIDKRSMTNGVSNAHPRRATDSDSMDENDRKVRAAEQHQPVKKKPGKKPGRQPQRSGTSLVIKCFVDVPQRLCHRPLLFL